jgi:hypothetical protein
VDRAVVKRVTLLLFAACACVKGSPKDDHAAPTAASPPSETTATTTRTAAPSPGPVSSAPPVAARPPAKPGMAIPVDSVASARAAIGKRIHLEGTGDNAKLGAVVVKGDLVVYCVDRKDGWDERNVPVVVEGILDDTSRAKARIRNDGSISAGTGEPIFQMTCDLVR